jgi:hypothetical protein
MKYSLYQKSLSEVSIRSLYQKSLSEVSFRSLFQRSLFHPMTGFNEVSTCLYLPGSIKSPPFIPCPGSMKSLPVFTYRVQLSLYQKSLSEVSIRSLYQKSLSEVSIRSLYQKSLSEVSLSEVSLSEVSLSEVSIRSLYQKSLSEVSTCLYLSLLGSMKSMFKSLKFTLCFKVYHVSFRLGCRDFAIIKMSKILN